MAFKINADKYSYTAAPEKEVESYSIELAKKLFSDEQSARMAEDELLGSAIENEKNERLKKDAEQDEDILAVRVYADDLSQELESEKTERKNEDELILAEVLKKANKADVYTCDSVDNKLLDKSDITHTHTAKDVGALPDSTKISDLENDINYQTYEQVENICETWSGDTLDKVYTKEELDEQFFYIHSDVGNALENANVALYQLDYKSDKTIIKNSEDTAYTFDFSDMYNTEIRLVEAANISFTFGDDEYADDYISGISFDSGETATSIDYTDSGILNWVGTDCTTSDGLSIFQPSANTHYDIVFYFNGAQFIGLVNGFVPATGNEAV